MSAILDAWSALAEAASGVQITDSFDPSAGTDRGVFVHIGYTREPSNELAYQMTWGGVPARNRYQIDSPQASGNAAKTPHQVVFFWNEDDIAARVGNSFGSTWAISGAVVYRFCSVSDCVQNDPLGGSNIQSYNAEIGTSHVVNPVSAAGQYQFAGLVHGGTRNRTYSWTQFANAVAAFVGVQRPMTFDVAANDAGGETTCEAVQSSDDDHATLLCAFNVPEAAGAASSIDNVNGNDKVAMDSESNTIVGTGFTGATSVQMGGIEQAYTVISDTEIEFDAQEAGLASDLKVGQNYTLQVFTPAGDPTISVELIPIFGNSYTDVSGLPWDPASRSLFDGQVPAVANGDQIQYGSTTDAGFNVTVNPDGTFSIPGSGTGKQVFPYLLWRAADNGGRWAGPFVAYVNHQAVVTDVNNGVAIDPDTAGAIPIDGDHFGEAQLTGKVYVQDEDPHFQDPPVSANAVEQTVNAWANQQIEIQGYDVTGLGPTTTKYTVVQPG